MKPSSSRRMLADTVTVGGWTFAVKVAGAVKVILAARMFGAGDAMDAYLIAFLLPSFFIDLLAGPLDTALVPALVELREKRGRPAAEDFYRGVLASVGAAFLVVAFLTAVTAGLFLPLLASSFTPDKLADTRQLLLMMIAVVPLSGLSVTWRAVLNSERRFAFAAIVPLVTPVISIAAILIAGKQYGVMALAAGTLAGGAMEAAAGAVGARLAGYNVLPTWSGVGVALREVTAQYFPLVAVTLVMTGTALIDQGIAARLGSGSVAALSYGTRLLGVLIVVGPTAVGTAVLPHLSAGVVSGGAGAMRRSLRNYVLIVLAVILPVTAGLIYFSEPIIRVLFENGSFSQDAIRLVARIQQASLLQLPIAILLALEIRLISALRQNRILYNVAALSVLLTFILDLLLMRWLGVIGIALAGVAIRLVSGLYLSCKISRLHAWGAGFQAADRLT